MHISRHFKAVLHDLELKTISERCCDIFLLNYCKMLVNNWFLYYPNCRATRGEGEGGNLEGMGLISFLINSSLLPNAAIRDNAANLKQLRLERLNIPQRIANRIQSFSPPGHWLKSGSSQEQWDCQASSSAGQKDALKPAEGLMLVSEFWEIIHCTPVLLLEKAVTSACRMFHYHSRGILALRMR